MIIPYIIYGFILVIYLMIIYTKLFPDKIKLAISAVISIELLTQILLDVPWTFLPPIHVLFLFLMISLYFSIVYYNIEIKNKENNFLVQSSIIRTLTLKGKLQPYFPLVGLIIVFILLSYNYAKGDSFGRNDRMVMFMSLCWFFYNSVPSSYSMERDFIFLFLNILVVILIAPSQIFIFFTGQEIASGSAWESDLVYILLGKPLHTMFEISGLFPTSASGIIFKFVDGNGDIISVSIARSCTGIYSVAIFASAFVSFILNHSSKFDYNTIIILSLGIGMSFIANLLRMFIIVFVGHKYGTDAMMFTHYNIGWFIFIIWVSFFWYLLFNYLLPKSYFDN